MKELIKEAGKADYKRREDGTFGEGNSANNSGRPANISLPLETLALKKATKELVKEYKEKLAEALPKIEPVLVAKAIEGDMVAIKEVNDRVLGKSEQKSQVIVGIVPIPILGGVTLNEVYKDNSIKENNSIKETP